MHRACFAKGPPIPAHAARPQTSFDPADAVAIADWHLADNGQVYVPASRGIGIDSLVAITFDAAHQTGAKGVADAPRDRDMKVRMHDITVLGGPSVLDPAQLDAAGRRRSRPCP